MHVRHSTGAQEQAAHNNGGAAKLTEGTTTAKTKGAAAANTERQVAATRKPEARIELTLQSELPEVGLR
jgi:hypothetical protein